MVATANYTKSSAQEDLERRLKNGNVSSKMLSTAEQAQPEGDDENAREYVVEGNDLDDYLNVDPEYMTYANKTEKPYKAASGVIRDFEEQLAEDSENVATAKFAESKSEDDDEKSNPEDDESKGDESKTQPTTSATAAKKTAASGSQS